jgi:Flp pilus assembly protein TadD
MRIAIRSLYTMRDPRAAENDFRKVLSVDPDHYGAMQGLAIALDQTGRSDQSRPLWQKVLLLARASNDNRVADLAGQKLASPR